MQNKLPSAASEAPAALACAIALRTARADRKISLRQLSAKLGLHPATLSSWELGQRLPDSEVVARVLGFLRVSAAEFDRVLTLCRRASDLSLVEVLDAETPPLLWTYEQVVAEVAEWAPTGVPELLQTSDYARLVLAGGLSVHDDFSVDVFARVARQDVLRRGELPTRYTFFLGEAALSHPRVAHVVMLEQLRHVLHLSRLPGVSIRVLSSQNAPGNLENFILCRKVNSSLVAIFQHAFCNIYLAKPEQVAGWRMAASRLDKLAFGSQESRDLISSKIGELESSDQLGRDVQSGESNRCA